MSRPSVCTQTAKESCKFAYSAAMMQPLTTSARTTEQNTVRSVMTKTGNVPSERKAIITNARQNEREMEGKVRKKMSK